MEHNGLQTEITEDGNIWIWIGINGARLEEDGIRALQAELESALEQTSVKGASDE